MNIKKTIGGTLSALIFAGVLAFSVSGAVKGFVFVQVWQLFGKGIDGKSSLICGGNMTMTVKNHTLESRDSGSLISAGGNCQMKLIDVNLKAGSVVSAGGNAKVIIEGGRIEGTSQALSVGGNAIIEVRSAEIIGRVSGDEDQLIGVKPTSDSP